MPIPYEDRYAREIQTLAVKRGISIQGKTKAQLIRELRQQSRSQSKRSVSPRRSPRRLQSYESCVKKLTNSPRIRSPYAVCYSSVYKK